MFPKYMCITLNEFYDIDLTMLLYRHHRLRHGKEVARRPTESLLSREFYPVIRALPSHICFLNPGIYC